MFYGIPSPKASQDLKLALDTLTSVYPGQVYANDMLITISRNLTFRSDKKFIDSFLSSAEDDKQKSQLWRLHTMAWAAKNVLHLDGDFVECGVHRGFSAHVICTYLEFQNLSRQYYLYDTFAGLSELTSTVEERNLNSSYTLLDSDAWYREVCDKFASYGNVHVVRGVVPYSFQEAAPEKIAFLHIDMNSEQAEMLALENLFDKIVPGGMIILDDFGWSGHANQAKAELAFMTERGHPVLELPTGQGLIIKHA